MNREHMKEHLLWPIIYKTLYSRQALSPFVFPIHYEFLRLMSCLRDNNWYPFTSKSARDNNHSLTFHNLYPPTLLKFYLQMTSRILGHLEFEGAANIHATAPSIFYFIYKQQNCHPKRTSWLVIYHKQMWSPCQLIFIDTSSSAGSGEAII